MMENEKFLSTDSISWEGLSSMCQYTNGPTDSYKLWGENAKLLSADCEE